MRAERDAVVRLRRGRTDGRSGVQRCRFELLDLRSLYGCAMRGWDMQRHGNVLDLCGGLRGLYGPLRRRDVQWHRDLLVVRGGLRRVCDAPLWRWDVQRLRDVCDLFGRLRRLRGPLWRRDVQRLRDVFLVCERLRGLRDDVHGVRPGRRLPERLYLRAAAVRRRARLCAWERNDVVRARRGRPMSADLLL